MAKQLISTSELAGTRVVGGKKATKRIGKVRSCVFHPKEKRCVGFIVKRPDLLWMFRRKDMFVSIDGYDFEDGRIVVHDDSEATDRGACKHLGVNWDDCVLWVGMPVMTQEGDVLGMVGSVSFSFVTGAVESLETSAGATSNALLGKRTIPASLIMGFRRGMGTKLSQSAEAGGKANDEANSEAELGAILVAKEAEDVAAEGGLAEQAGKATAVAMDKVHTAADKVKPKVSEAAEVTGAAINKGAYATGKQIGKAKTMFSDFKDEYDKARGEKPRAESGKKTSIQKKKAGGMFASFKEEYNKARHGE